MLIDVPERINAVTGRPLSEKPGTVRARIKNHGQDLCKHLQTLVGDLRTLCRNRHYEYQKIYVDSVKAAIRKARHQVRMIRRDDPTV